MVLVLADGTGPQHFDQSQGILAVRKGDADKREGQVNIPTNLYI